MSDKGTALFKAFLEKASKNVRAHTRNLPPEVAHKRLMDFLTRKGFTVEQSSREPGKNGYAFGVEPDGKSWVRETRSNPAAHEAGHLLMTPPGKTTDEYQADLNDTRHPYERYADKQAEEKLMWGSREEYAANAIEHGLMRRAGVSPAAHREQSGPLKGMVNRNTGTIQSQKLNPEYTGHRPSYQNHYDKFVKPEIPRGRERLNAFDEGRYVPQPGGTLGPANTPDAKINERADRLGKVAVNPVARIKLAPKTAPAPAPKPSAIGQGERDIIAGKAPTTSATISEPPAPAQEPAGKPRATAIDYSQHLLPASTIEGGYRMSALEGKNATKIFFTHPSGEQIGTAHIDHPEGNPDAPTGHRFEIHPKVGQKHHKVIMDHLARAVRHHLYGPPASPIKKAEGKRSADWLGRPVISSDDSHMLETSAAIHEFQGKLPRSEAEDRAHTEYRREHHLTGAAHHLAGMKVAGAAQQTEEARKHGAMFALHMKALGHDPHADVPGEVKSRLKPEDHKMYRFKAHKADLFVLDQHKPTK